MEQQSWILRGLLAQLENKQPHEEFLRLKKQSIQYRANITYPSKAAEKQENIKRNRYKDIVPFDHSRVKLNLVISKHDSDYINASFIKGVSGSRAYIATQGPLPNTVLDFWRMLWQYNIQVIVMACREFEMGRKKCERYWPETQLEPFVCEPFTVHCALNTATRTSEIITRFRHIGLNDFEEAKGDYVTRILRVTYLNCSRTLHQLHYVNWPDHGVPDSIPPILEMVQEMRSYQAHDEVPICIHCSAGCGRTGALCVIDYTWNLLKQQMITEDFNIYELVENMRIQRPSVVQTKEQYELVYRTIKFLFERYLLSMEMQTSRDVVAVEQSSVTNDNDGDLENHDYPSRPESEYRLDSESQQMFSFIEEQGKLPSPFEPFCMPLPVDVKVSSQSQKALYTADILCAMRARDEQRTQQALLTLPETPPLTEDTVDERCRLDQFARTSPITWHVGQSAITSNERHGVLPSKPATPLVVAPCLTVEDPYFESPLSSPLSADSSSGSLENLAPASQRTANSAFQAPRLTLNDQRQELSDPILVVAEMDKEIPPPLPERTPESYVLANNTVYCSEPHEMLEVIIPPHAAALEMGGSPPSPIPPLPERTPESFELAINEAPVKPVDNLDKIGKSSEWAGNSLSLTTEEPNTWTRSKSLRIQMTFTAAPPPTNDLFSASIPSLHLPSPTPPPHILTPPVSPQAIDRLTPPIPERTPESFILATGEVVENTVPCLQTCETTMLCPRIGISSEWAGTSQTKKFMDGVMKRSRSVRAKSSREEPLTAVQLAPPPVAMAEGGSEVGLQVNHRPSECCETSDDKLEKNSGKSFSRSKSLKFFTKHKIKPTTAPPPPPLQSSSATTSGSPSSIFKFGFGKRFGKPKGPRSHPDTWF